MQKNYGQYIQSCGEELGINISRHRLKFLQIHIYLAPVSCIQSYANDIQESFYSVFMFPTSFKKFQIIGLFYKCEILLRQSQTICQSSKQ